MLQFNHFSMRSVSPNRRPPPTAPQRSSYQQPQPQSGFQGYQQPQQQGYQQPQSGGFQGYQPGPPQISAPPIPNRPGSRKPVLPKSVKLTTYFIIVVVI